MALINTAGILAGRRGFRVLVIDLDLEAPGISYLIPRRSGGSSQERLPDQRQKQLGFVDLLNDARDKGEKADLFTQPASVLVETYTQEYTLPENARKIEGGLLRIMPAGKPGQDYIRRLESLHIGDLYQQGVGEPLIRAFKKKLAESGLFDYVLVDSRTGFSDEGGICTRDLADYLMILSGLNRQNIEGTCQFLRALRWTTEGKKPFQIILSPVPIGEDALLDGRVNLARSSFKEAWGAEVEMSVEIPYHPQLALTEEPHIFRRQRGYLFEAYRKIEREMLRGLGHTAQAFARRAENDLQQKASSIALQSLRHMVRLDEGGRMLSQVATRLTSEAPRILRDQRVGEGGNGKTALETILGDPAGRPIVEFFVENFPQTGSEWETRDFLSRLKSLAPDLAKRLYERRVNASPNNPDLALAYAVFLLEQLHDPAGADTYFQRAVEADPSNISNLISYAVFLAKDRGELGKAEQYYRRALEAQPDNPLVLGSYAHFASVYRNDCETADQLFRRAIDKSPAGDVILGNYAIHLAYRHDDWDGAAEYVQRALQHDPDDPVYLCNWGQILAVQGHLPEAEEALLSSLRKLKSSDHGVLAEVSFSLWLVSLVRGEDAKAWESGFKFQVQAGFRRYPWSFQKLLEKAEQKVSPDELKYARALASAFLDEGKVSELQSIKRWQELEPMDPKAALQLAAQVSKSKRSSTKKASARRR